jgi:hypothetical protein
MHEPAFAERAFKHVMAQHLLHDAIGGEYWQAIVFGVLRQHYEQYASAPNAEILTHLVFDSLLKFLPDARDPRCIEILSQLASFLHTRESLVKDSLAVADETLETVCKRAVRDEQALAEIKAAQSGTADLMDLGQRIQAIRDRFAGVSPSHVISGVSKTVSEPMERIRTGLTFVDSLFGGGQGPVNASGFGVIAKQGAGKTTLLSQACVNHALLGKPSLFVMTEQGFQPSVKAKVLSCATGISFNTISDYRFDLDAAAKALGWQPEQIEIMHARVDLFDRYFNVLDLVQYPGGTESVEVELLRLQQKYGVNVGLFAIDWAGPMAEYMRATDRKRFGDSRDLPVRAIADSVASISAKHNTFGMVSQQMAGHLCKKGAYHNHDHYCAQDCSSFTQLLKYCVVINGRDEKLGVDKAGHDVQKLRVAKSRDDEPGRTMLVRNIDGAHFVEATGWEQSGKRWQQKGRAVQSEHRLPSEDRVRNTTAVEA